METGTDIYKAIILLKAGELVAIPTETVYGLAANGLDEDAVLKIFKAKSRPAFNPLILHCGNAEQAEKHTSGFSTQVKKLTARFWPGPLTIVLPKAPHVPMLVTGGLETVALRVPAHPLTLELLNQIKFPLAAPSANRSGSISPTLPETVKKQMGDKIDYILDGGQCQIGLESTIISFENDKPVLLRYGGIPLEEIENVLQTKITAANTKADIKSPGMMNSHYAPSKKLVAGSLEELTNFIKKKPGNYAALTFTQSLPDIAMQNQKILSKSSSFEEAARNFFKYLHELDETDTEMILAEFLPETGLGHAINDRLKRAAAPKN